MLPDIFLCDSPGVALLAAISISASAMASVRQLHYRDADRAAKLEDISARAQLNAAALLRSLGTAEHDQLLRSRRGTVALLRAATARRSHNRAAAHCRGGAAATAARKSKFRKWPQSARSRDNRRS